MSKDNARQAVCAAVSRILKEERTKRELSLVSVAAKAGLSRQMISFVEQETRNPTLDTLLRICDALDIDIQKVLKRAKREAQQ